MISKKMTQAINKQINAELYSAYLYMSMSAWASFKGYGGTAKWLSVQAQEEAAHAMKFAGYLQDQGEQVLLTAIDGPATQFESMADVFGKTLEHEKKVTGLINGLAALAAAEKDYASSVMLQWFITEQVEEEKNASEILQKLQLAGASHGALFMIDRELGSRGKG